MKKIISTAYFSGGKYIPRWILEKKFDKKYTKLEYCWEWDGARDKNGYGLLSYKNFVFFAHRISYELYKGKISKGRIICHHCDNPGCVNPEHLYAGTPQDNVDDMMLRRRHHSQKQQDKVLREFADFILNITEKEKSL